MSLEAGLTARRQTRVTFDHPETAATESVFAMRRLGHHLVPESVSNVKRLSSGVWILAPINEFHLKHESSGAHAYTVRLTDVDAPSVLKEIPLQRTLSGELTGISPGALVASAGDHHFVKRVTAGATWANALTPLTGSLSSPVPPTGNYPMDRVLQSKANHAPMTGYALELFLPHAEGQNADWIGIFSFGGEIDTAGYGRYALMFRGDGRCKLVEWINGAWVEQHEWQYGRFEQGAGNIILMQIIPHFPHYIEFTSAATGSGSSHFEQILALSQLNYRLRAGWSDAGSVYLHQTTNRSALQYGTGPGFLRPITGEGKIAFDLRRDLRARVQINRLGYPATGTLTDAPFQIPYGYGTAHIARAQLIGYNYYNGATVATAAAIKLQNVLTDTDLPADTETYVLGGQTYLQAGYTLPGARNLLRAVLSFSTLEAEGSRYHTPMVMGYDVLRNGHLQQIAPAAPTIVTDPAQVMAVTVTGPGYAPDHETAFLSIEDPGNQLPLLRTRSRIATRIETTFDADQADRCVLFEGYTGRVTANLSGKEGMTFPSPEWRTYSVELMGKWDRLQNKFFHQNFFFNDEALSPSGRFSTNMKRPWKVTDIIRYLLNTEGFADSQLDIPDNRIRIFPSHNNPTQELYRPTPGTEIAPYLQMLARDFLNAYLVWDANAGAAGMWRLLNPPDADAVPVWNFVTRTPGGGSVSTIRREAFGAVTSPILDELSTYIIPPEGNVLTVSGGTNPVTGRRYQQFYINYKSFNSPTHANLADPTSLDYIGHIRPIEYVDPTLNTQGAVDFVGFRVFRAACHGRKLAEFEAELVLFDPRPFEPSIYTVRKRRPLRAGDVVTLNADRWVIHACNPIYDHDTIQRAHYEAEFFRPDIGATVVRF
jgi:hypothetical protein